MLRGIDRFLATILVGLLAVVVVAIVLVWRSPAGTELEYRTGSEPDDVVHNYAVAITKGNEERAKSYLSPEVLADIEKMEENGFNLVRSHTRLAQSGTRVVVVLENIEDGLATVNADITRFHSDPSPFGLFAIFDDNQFTSSTVVRLRQFDGEWKIVDPFDYYMFS